MMPSALAVFGLMAGPMRSGLMSLLGQTRMSDCTIAMSAFPPLATRQRTSPKVRRAMRRHAAPLTCKNAPIDAARRGCRLRNDWRRFPRSRHYHHGIFTCTSARLAPGFQELQPREFNNVLSRQYRRY
jgi:hypothetical protein